jgi:lipopolysaccharide/colanic/teichoic acid biosynthesis glycosyltransferase
MVALLLTIALSPIMAPIAVLICIDSPGWPVFTQERVGENGRRFRIYKFRTMINADDSHYKEYLRKMIIEGIPYKVDRQGEAVYKIIDDPRITRFGALLRATNLDELPQVINVLIGDMSLVGPRPDIPFAVEMYDEWHRKRLSVKPGMTGLWQVSGANQVPFDEMVRLDIEYIERESFMLDTKILFKTTGLVLLRINGKVRGKEGKDNG